MIKLILLLLYILLILTVIFLERKSPTEALLWVLVMVCLPYAGAILYLVFGSTMAIKLTAFFRKKRLAPVPDSAPASPKKAPAPAFLSEEDLQVMHFNAVYNGSEVTHYRDAFLFTSGKSHYERLFKDIRSAKKCIYVEFYTIHHDPVGEAFVNELAKKAREGVEVLVMCDFIANLSTPRKMFDPLTHAGGQVIRVKPYLTHYRSHRKIVVIDHEISYIGGMNIGKQYANMAKVKNPWRDTQVRLEGVCSLVLEKYFLTDWLCSVKRSGRSDAVSRLNVMAQTVLPDQPCPSGDAAASGAAAGSNTPDFSGTAAQSGGLCQFIVGGVDNDREAVKMCYLSMMRSARRKIRIQTPYFIPDASVLDALKTAAASGVEIELMIPGIKASFFLDPVTTWYCGQLLEYGAKVYKYNGYIHAKTMVIDEELCCIGSVNMDMRSLMVDDEVCGVFYSNGLVQRYSALFEKDIADCAPYTREQFLSRPRKERMQESIFLMFAPLM